jgi:hypothetical protein
MTTYTIRWLDESKPDPIQTIMFDHLDSVRGYIRAANQQAGIAPRRWLGLTETTYTHFGGDDPLFATGLKSEHAR